MTNKDILQLESFSLEDESTSLLSQSEKKNQELLKAKLIYLFYYGGSSSLIAYLPVYYKQLNMNDLEAGALASLLPICRFVGAPIWGAITDRTGRHKSVLLSAVLVYTLLISTTYPFSLINNTSTQPNMTSNISMSWNKSVSSIDCVIPEECVARSTNISLTTRVPPSSFRHQLTFWLLFVLTSIAFIFMSTIGPIIDAMVVTMGTNVDYGNPRLWAAFGFGFFGFLSGLAANDGRLEPEIKDKANFLWPFAMFLILNTLGFLVCLTLKGTGSREPSCIVLSYLKSLVTNPRVLMFMAVVLIMGICSGVITWLMFIFLKDLGGSQTLLGISIAVYCASEVIVFSLSGHMIRLIGSNNIFYVALVAFILRLMAYSYLENPWLVLPIEPLHGFTFAAMWAACVSYATDISPPEVATTVIGLMTGVHFGLGWGLGGTLGGIVYQYYGPRVLFRSCAVMCGVGIAIHTFGVVCLKHQDEPAEVQRGHTIQ